MGLKPDRLEITNYKHHLILKLGQINSKFQYSITKAFTIVVSHRFANPVLPVMIPQGTTVNGLLFWNFEFGSLGFVWDLVFGAWNFHDFHWAGNFC